MMKSHAGKIGFLIMQYACEYARVQFEFEMSNLNLNLGQISGLPVL
jgi:hypothetical protein